MPKEKQYQDTAYSAFFAQSPKVALLGRPNVGKSTLFNRLIRSKRAITHDMPGVTRDRMEGWVRPKNKAPFILVDTGGITLDSNAASVDGPLGIRGFEEEILRQAKQAVQEAEVICLVVDGREGLTPFDSHLADYLRRCGKPLLVAVNKVDGEEKADLLQAEFHVLGLDMMPCSAEHGFNVRELLVRFQHMLDKALPGRKLYKPSAPAAEKKAGAGDSEEAGEDNVIPEMDDGLDGTAEAEDEKRHLRLALLGRPNVGKSSLVNAMTRSERMIVSNVAGTTRDSVDVPVTLDGRDYLFVDSAGVRKRPKVVDSIERYSVNSAIKTSTKADITLLVIDAVEGLRQQDKRLLELLDERKIPFMVLMNKSDLLSQDELKRSEKEVREILAYCPHVPLIPVSAKERRNLKKVLPLADSILKESRVRVGTGQLNRMLEQLLQQRQPPLLKRKRAKFYYMTQAESQPPTFVFFVSDLERVPDSYSRYLERSLRKLLKLKHAPIRVRFRERSRTKTD